ncbi:hypothetical protein PSHT_08270 [Puccinia striiformis]|uniref:Uncharacterized protein n=1 Tax=Puccinia striiformis TaxID=27350 RepID=A0A2S4VRE0_9BASI|nr:hypothetical protein PSHT_08270 [Puccinia striiformis]
MLLLTKILVAIQLLHCCSVLAYPNSIAKNLVKRTEEFLGGAASHHSLPGARTSIPDELESENHQLKGLSQGKHGPRSADEMKLTPVHVVYQGGDIDDGEAIRRINEPRMEAQIHYNLEFYGNNMGQDGPTKLLLAGLKKIAVPLVYSKVESPELETQEHVQQHVQYCALQALEELKKDTRRLARGIGLDQNYLIARLDKLENLIRQHTGVARDPISEFRNMDGKGQEIPAAIEAGDSIADQHIDAMLLSTKILVAIQLLHCCSVLAYPNFIARNLAKRSEEITVEAASHHSLPEAGTSMPEELESGNRQLKGLSQEKHGQWSTNEIIPTSGNVGHQKRPAGIDESKALDELHNFKGKLEEFKGLPFEFLPLESRLLIIVAFCSAAPCGNHQLKGPSADELSDWLTNEISPSSGNLGHQQENNMRGNDRAIAMLYYLEEITILKVNHVHELPVLETPKGFRDFVTLHGLEVLDKIYEVRSQPQGGQLADRDPFRGLLEEIRTAWHCEEFNPAKLGRTSSKQKYIHQKTCVASFRSEFAIGKMNPPPIGTSREQVVVAAHPLFAPSQDEENMDDYRFDDRADYLYSHIVSKI